MVIMFLINWILQSTFFNLVIGENEIEFTQNLGLPTTAKINFIYRNLYITI